MDNRRLGRRVARLDQEPCHRAGAALVGSVPGVEPAHRARRGRAGRGNPRGVEVERGSADRRRQQAKVVDPMGPADARTAGVAGQRDMEVAAASVAGGELGVGRAGVVAVRGGVAVRRTGVAVRRDVIACVVPMAGVVRVPMPIARGRMPMGRGGVRRPGPAAALTRRDAEHAARRHAGEHLREQEQREHEAGERMGAAAEHEGMREGGARLERGPEPTTIGSSDYIAPETARVKRDAGEDADNSAWSSIRTMLTCNIDQRGKTVRFILGAFVESTGLLLGVLWFLGWTPGWTIWPAIGFWVSGIFVLFEAAAGWCAVRALGFKTPI